MYQPRWLLRRIIRFAWTAHALSSSQHRNPIMIAVSCFEAQWFVFFFHILFFFQRYRGFVRITHNTFTNYMAWQEARGVQDELLRILEAHAWYCSGITMITHKTIDKSPEHHGCSRRLNEIHITWNCTMIALGRLINLVSLNRHSQKGEYLISIPHQQ